MDEERRKIRERERDEVLGAQQENEGRQTSAGVFVAHEKGWILEWFGKLHVQFAVWKASKTRKGLDCAVGEACGIVEAVCTEVEHSASAWLGLT